MDTNLPAYISRNSSKLSSGCVALFQTAQIHHLDKIREEISGPDVGRILQLFATNAKNVLEVGTLIGLGTMFIAEALPSNGKVTTVDIENGPAQELARRFWQDYGLLNKINAVWGRDILEFIPEIEDDSLDLVFVDAIKADYGKYLEAILPKVRSRGTFIFDDTLDGNMESPQTERDEAIVEFNGHLSRDRRFLYVNILDIGDGLTIAVKK